MGVARLVVVEGPDLGREFEIPLRGGGIGRESGNVVQLADLSVSRSHCSLERRGGKIVLLDGGSRNHTLVNGQPITEHVLEKGDQIVIGQTRLTFLPREDSEARARRESSGRVTMEVGSRELFSARTLGLHTGEPSGEHDRARRHLAALAQLGDGLRAVTEKEHLGHNACQAAVSGLSARRAFMFSRDAVGRLNPVSAAVAAGIADSAIPALPGEIVDKVVSEEKAVTLELAGAGRSAGLSVAAAPIFGTLTGSQGEAPVGVLYVERAAGEAWDHVDLMATGCMAHLISSALAGFEEREVLLRENDALTEKLASGELVGRSPPMRAIFEFVNKVGPSDATVLLTGESGSGKEMVARAVHRASRRSKGPFVAINCAALTESLIESELFGHEKGAFTGATERKLGRFELADKGTLFLDEVGELPPNCQTKFLRVLEERVFERVGGGKTIAVDVRVVAATNRNLPEMVRLGRFRDDLYYRLSVIHHMVPPLRERKHDIGDLARHFLARLRSQVARRVTDFSPEALEALTHHPWPGNVRELKNAVERAIVLGDGELIQLGDLPPNISGTGPMAGATAPSLLMGSPAGMPAAGMPAAAMPATAMPVGMPTPPAGSPNLAGSPAASAVERTPAPAIARPQPLRDLERQGIVAALRATGGNKAQAAAILEIDRSTLYKKIKDYGIT